MRDTRRMTDDEPVDPEDSVSVEPDPEALEDELPQVDEEELGGEG